VLEQIKSFWLELIEKLPKPLKNFYVLSGIFFIFWMLFVDIDKFSRQWRKYRANEELLRESRFYEDKIRKADQELKGLKNDPEKLERLAREKYYMHKKTEDVYVIEKKVTKEE
jgi:cell division protein DivIC